MKRLMESSEKKKTNFHDSWYISNNKESYGEGFAIDSEYEEWDKIKYN